MAKPIDLTPQQGPAEVITLSEFWSRLRRGERVEPTTLVLVSVARLQVVQAELDKLKATTLFGTNVEGVR